jgi:hypothetical protein
MVAKLLLTYGSTIFALAVCAVTLADAWLRGWVDFAVAVVVVVGFVALPLGVWLRGRRLIPK